MFSLSFISLFIQVIDSACILSQTMDHDYLRRKRFLAQPTKKLNCPAVCIIRELVFFPAYTVSLLLLIKAVHRFHINLNIPYMLIYYYLHITRCYICSKLSDYADLLVRNILHLPYPTTPFIIIFLMLFLSIDFILEDECYNICQHYSYFLLCIKTLVCCVWQLKFDFVCFMAFYAAFKYFQFY